MVNVHCYAPSIAAGVNPKGNAEIHAIDQSGIVVTIEIDSSHWKEVLSKLSRLSGVGIPIANQLPKQ